MCILCDINDVQDHYLTCKISDCRKCLFTPQSYINVVAKNIDCYGCFKLRKLPKIKYLEYLNVNNCLNLEAIPYIKGLIELRCCRCPKIREIPPIQSLTNLYCYDCVELRKIPPIKNLFSLYMQNSYKIQSIIGVPALRILRADNCISLEKIEQKQIMLNPKLGNCPFLAIDCYWFNSDMRKKNISKLITLQRFCKKNFRYFIFKRWVKSQEFNEWFYAPENVGGIKHKKVMERVISAH